LHGVFDSDFLETATDEELARLQELSSRPDAKGRLPDFGHVVARFSVQQMRRPNA
jgi:hypothetical protein